MGTRVVGTGGEGGGGEEWQGKGGVGRGGEGSGGVGRGGKNIHKEVTTAAVKLLLVACTPSPNDADCLA